VKLIFLGVVTITITSFALLSNVVSHKLHSYQARTRLNKVGGSALICAGLMTSMMQRSQ